LDVFGDKGRHDLGLLAEKGNLQFLLLVVSFLGLGLGIHLFNCEPLCLYVNIALHGLLFIPTLPLFSVDTSLSAKKVLMVSTTTWDAASCFATALEVFLHLGRNDWVVALVVPPSRSTILDCGPLLLLHDSYSSCHLGAILHHRPTMHHVEGFPFVGILEPGQCLEH
jgi:hypothetical protein